MSIQRWTPIHSDSVKIVYECPKCELHKAIPEQEYRKISSDGTRYFYCNCQNDLILSGERVVPMVFSHVEVLVEDSLYARLCYALDIKH